MGSDADFLGRLGPVMQMVLPMLDERARRLVLGMAAQAAGDGGTGAVAALTGASWQTVAGGRAEVTSGESAPPGRVRRPGGGRKRLASTDPGLAEALETLIRASMRGDPQSPLVYTTRSVRHLADDLSGQGRPCSPQTVWRQLRRSGYTLQSNSRAAEGRQDPRRDEQFRYIAAQAKEHRGAGQPVISVDAKKREQVGNYGQHGRDWGPAGEPVVVRSHDFPDKDGQHAVPYGIYDEDANAGFVNVGTDGNTAALAVESIRRWWNLAGRDAYPGATRLLVACDAGGSNSCTNRSWKAGLAALAAETGLEITVCHFPPGTSKWNKIEHRLFCQISLAWRGRPLTSYDVIIDTIGAVTTSTGLTTRAVLDTSACPTGIHVSDEQMKDIEDRYLTRHDQHGDWNYTLHPRPVRDPQPQAARARPGPPRLCGRDELNHPALTGTGPADLTALAAALEVPFGAHRAQRDYKRRGRGRVNAIRRGAGSNGKRRTGLTDQIQAYLMRRHLRLPVDVIAAVLGVHYTTVSHATSLISKLLTETGIPLPPAAPPPRRRIRTLDDLRDYAARHGITITSPPGPADTPPQATLTTPAAP
jgi:hypothetical protein